ncbi:MAG: lmo0937 family membrane protein [Candidatus Nephthysia bennettiae]|nr:MAG: lmo0937 family membrane protein [Candidatus Dormibacteraeota bacterium]
MLWIVVVILVVLWLLGFLLLHVTSALIHLLLVLALIAILYNLFVARRSRV